MSALYLRVIIDRKKYDAPINLYWPAKKFHPTKYCLKRNKDDKDYEDYNMIIRDCLTKANEIIKRCRLSNTDLTLDLFREEYSSDNIKLDFIKFFQYHLNQRYRKKIITERTYKGQLAALNKLKEFTPILKFKDIKYGFKDEFEAFLRNKHKNKANTIIGRHKTIKTYMNLANEEIFFQNPYKKYKLPKMVGTWKSLSNEELKKVYEHYCRMDEEEVEKRCLRRFLFSCFTGLRLSDMKNLSKAHITKDYFTLKPIKTRKKDTVLHLPISNTANKLLDEEIKLGDYKNIFNRVSDQYSNTILRGIGEKLELRIKLHHHIGRETFATLYLENGGNLEVLKEYLGHSDISTTMKYIHISEGRKKNEINKIEQSIL